MLEPTRSRHAVRARTSVLWLLIGLLTQEQQEHKVAVADKAARVRECRRPTRRREASSLVRRHPNRGSTSMIWAPEDQIFFAGLRPAPRQGATALDPKNLRAARAFSFSTSPGKVLHLMGA